MSLTHVLVVLRARWRFALLVMAAVVALVSAINLLLPKRYTASAAVVLDVKSPDPIAGMVLPGMNVSSYMATQADVFRSERVALRAVDALNLMDAPDLRARWEEETSGVGDYRLWLGQEVLRDVEIRPARESNVITATYTSSDPQRAAEVVNALVAAYIGTTVDLRVEPAKQYSAFFEERARQNREDLEQAQARLSAFQRENGIVATGDRIDIEESKLSELSSQLIALQTIADESSGRRAQALSTPEQMPEVMASPLVAQIKTELARQEARLTELSSRLGAQHPQVIETRASVTELRGRVATETRRIAGSLNVSHTVNEGRLAQLRAAVEAQRARILQMKTLRDEASVLVRDVENAQRAYDAVSARGSQTSMESQTTQTNVSVLNQAVPPRKPSSPRVGLNAAVAVVLGLLLALAGALVREWRDQRLRTDDDVLRLLRQPVLGVLPSAPRRVEMNSRNRLRFNPGT